MTFEEAYNYLLSLGHIARKEYMADPRACGWYLDRLQFFLDVLGNPEKKIPHYIHVTGTSGKGSVCLMLTSILRAAGKRVGTLTSPHPSVILERWEVNGETMTKKEFVDMVTMLKPKLDEYIATTPYDMLSFTELMTACAFYFFAKKKVVWAVIEVGCGGRYDATNVLPYKDVAVITNIGLDHKEILGNTKSKIAYEKAGIIKPGAKIFTAEKNTRIRRIIEKECVKTKTILTFVKPHFTVVPQQTSSLRSGTSYMFNGTRYDLAAYGHHQIGNAILCTRVAETLGIRTPAIQRGLRTTILPTCMEIVSYAPLIVLDGAHNEDKIGSTVATANEFRNQRFFKNLHLIVAFAANKDIETLVRQLAALRPASVACTHFTSNIFRRAADPAALARLFKKYTPKTRVRIFLDPLDAFAWSQKQQKQNDMVLSTGSIFLSGHLRTLFKKI